MQISVSDIEKMDYSQFVGFIRERNRPSGGIKTVHTVAVNAFIDDTKRMLEIGSNTGFTSVNMSLLTGCEVIGIDPNPPSVDEAKAYAKELNADKVSFQTASALTLPFDDASFDVVWSSNVTSFIGDKNQAIAEYLRVLKPNGILVVVPIYYRTTPPAEIVQQVSEAIGAEIQVWDKAFWNTLFTQVASGTGQALEKIYDTDYRYLDRAPALQSYIDLLMEKDHLKTLGKEQQQAVRERCEHFMSLFNANLQYAGYSVMLYQKRAIADEAEFFLGESV